MNHWVSETHQPHLPPPVPIISSFSSLVSHSYLWSPHSPLPSSLICFSSPGLLWPSPLFLLSCQPTRPIILSFSIVGLAMLSIWEFLLNLLSCFVTVSLIKWIWSSFGGTGGERLQWETMKKNTKMQRGNRTEQGKDGRKRQVK